jgi:hypothetical protein
MIVARKNTKTTLVPVTTAPAVKAVTIVETKSKRKKNRKKKKGKSSGGNSLRGLGNAGSAYLRTLNDPFDCPPVRLGFGTMIPTRIGTAYCRGQAVLNADGSGQLWFSPTQVGLTASAANGGFVMFSKDGYNTTPTFAGSGSFVGNADDQKSMLADFDELRVVSAGIRIFCLIPRTNTPGIFGSGQYNPNSSGFIPNSTGSNPITTSALLALPESEVTFGYDPVQIVWRPDDLDRFRFSPYASLSNSAGIANGPALYCAFNACPSNGVVYWEAVAHYEGYASSQMSSQATVTDTPAVSSEYSSVDSLWSSVRNYLSPIVSSGVEYVAPYAMDTVNTAVGSAMMRMFRPRVPYRGRGSDWVVTT